MAQSLCPLPRTWSVPPEYWTRCLLGEARVGLNPVWSVQPGLRERPTRGTKFVPSAQDLALQARVGLDPVPEHSSGLRERPTRGTEVCSHT